MTELYKQVNRGKYNPIPECYSKHLQSLINSMLTVKMEHRPTCEEILNSPYIQKKKAKLDWITKWALKVLTQMNSDSKKKHEDNMMTTIRLPSDMHNLSKILPKPSYQEDSLCDDDTLSWCENEDNYQLFSHRPQPQSKLTLKAKF